MELIQHRILPVWAEQVKHLLLWHLHYILKIDVKIYHNKELRQD